MMKVVITADIEPEVAEGWVLPADADDIKRALRDEFDMDYEQENVSFRMSNVQVEVTES